MELENARPRRTENEIMRILSRSIPGITLPYGWGPIGAAVGLVVSAWLAVAQIESGETTSGEANPQAIADSVDRIPGSDSGRTKQSLDDAIDFARAHRQSLQQVSDYTAIFSMTEVVDGRVISHAMDLKFRRQPFSVYARCHAKRQPAREVIYVAGKNDDKLLIHEGGLRRSSR